MDDRLVTPSLREGDELDSSLRPRTLNEYVGQSAVKENLSIYMEAARKRREPLDHILLYGPPGLGKTALSMIIANEMGSQIRITSGPAIERPGDLASILTNLNAGDVLFIDEIHRLSRSVEEILYPAMEDSALDIMIGKGPSARAIRLDLPRFTLVGATTRMGLLSAPLRDRFGITFRLEFYAPDELTAIITRSARILNVSLDIMGAMEIARRSRGTPRIANRMLARMRDFAMVLGDGVITEQVAKEGLKRLNVDALGLDKVDREMLTTMIVKFAGRPVGLDTLAAATGEDAGTIEDVYEPYLLQLGFIMRTPRGRVPTPGAYAHLGIAQPANPEMRSDAQQLAMAYEDGEL